MSALNTALSVRLSEEDATFLNGLEVDGAVTASEKVRALIRSARQRSQGTASFPAALALSHSQVAPALRIIRQLQQEADLHSDVAVGLLTVAEEYLAVALTVPQPSPDVGAALRAHEARLVDCAARMVEQMLRWAITSTAPAYDPDLVSRRMAGLADLMQLVAANGAARSKGVS